MLKLRFKKIGRKRSPSYRVVIMKSTSKRDGKSIDEVGFYSPITKIYKLDKKKLEKWLNYGAQPTKTVFNLLKKAEIL